MTPTVNPILTVHKIFQTDTINPILAPVMSFFELLQESFVIPSVGESCTLLVADSTKYADGQYVWINGIGFLAVIGTPDSTHLYVQNNSSAGNSAAGTAVPIGTVMSASIPVPSGIDTSAFFPSASIQYGVVSRITLSTNNFATPHAVVFDTPFVSAPSVVLLSIHSSTNAGSVGPTQVYSSGITATGFNIVWDSNITSVVDIHWVALQ